MIKLKIVSDDITTFISKQLLLRNVTLDNAQYILNYATKHGVKQIDANSGHKEFIFWIAFNNEQVYSSRLGWWYDFKD